MSWYYTRGMGLSKPTSADGWLAESLRQCEDLIACLDRRQGLLEGMKSLGGRIDAAYSTFDGFRHSPVVPAAGESVLVSVMAEALTRTA